MSRRGAGGAPGRLRSALGDLGLGVRLAGSGGREGWIRTALTAVGVGLGVALLFLAAAVPNVLDAREGRGHARETPNFESEVSVRRGDTTFLWLDAATEFRGDAVGGQLLRPDGPGAPPPPGVARIPGPGEMVVSPALRGLLGSPSGALLKERLGYRIIGTIADRGLLEPGELRFYAGSATLSRSGGAIRSAGYGHDPGSGRFDPRLVVLVALICVVLLVPVGVFVATAVRFGGDRRDRRLAALRLVGADVAMTRRIAAGEALFGAGLGLLVGAGLFLGASRLAGSVRLWGVSAFPADVAPDALPAGLIVVAILVGAVLVTQSALRSVVIEPLGVVRHAALRPRRLWWRLVAPVVGVGVLAWTGSAEEELGSGGVYPIVLGAVLVLVGLTGLLPWLVEAVVRRLRGGPVAWQLAVRRLQLSSGTASRAVSGITVAVAGAIALQMVFGGMQEDFASSSAPAAAGASSGRADVVRADFSVATPSGSAGAPALAERMAGELGRVGGVRRVVATVQSYVHRVDAGAGPGSVTTLTVAGCATLRSLASLPSCRDGDTFVARLRGSSGRAREANLLTDEVARPGGEFDLGGMSGGAEEDESWTLPESSRAVVAVPDPVGDVHDGILATPGALAGYGLPQASTSAYVAVDHGVADAGEQLRNAAARLDPALRVYGLVNVERDRQYSSVQTGLRIGGTLTVALIAAGMLVALIEQLRERRRLLSVLVAFGTRRRTLAWSVLWQTAVPVLAGTVVAILGGLVLGRVMLGIVVKPVRDWWVFLPYAGIGAAAVLVVTLLSLPALWRMMRADGLRTE
ncbi:FtsX-like permease family protein [Actinacidiphila glaucinigra]|uniref:FtsX-like permease family protein n=1 Tax=Actinacidiphila glaucinigra TaxID=235986 RepID=UPI0035DD0654